MDRCYGDPYLKNRSVNNKNEYKMKILYYLFFVMIITLVSSCKTKFIPKKEPLDQIVLITGDTLYGQVDYFQEKIVYSEFYKKIRLIDTNGRKKRFKRKDIVSYKVNGYDYQSFTLKKQTGYLKNGSLQETRYSISPDGVQHFLKVGSKGKLSYYELEWIDRDNNDLTSMIIVKKAQDQVFMRADYGVIGIARKALSNYLADCPDIQTKIMNKDFKYVFQVVDYYNKHCSMK